MALFEPLETTVSALDVASVSEQRRQKLRPIIDFIQMKIDANQEIRLNFICTHNSRRSHLSQVWAQALAYHFNINNVFCYSGGTETTAVFPQAIIALTNAGFQIKKLSENANAIYSMKYASTEHPVVAFSKTYDDGFNPASAFAAILTCSEVDAACPLVEGAEQRISLPFEDPKAFDGTSQQAGKYEERSLEIATELFYVFSQIKTNNGR